MKDTILYNFDNAKINILLRIHILSIPIYILHFMFSILKKELIAYFGTLSGYIIIGIFLIINGLFLWVLPGEYNIADAGYANVNGLFQLAPWLFLFLCPAITMKAFTDEKQNGTWDLLITKPLRLWDIILGKYFAAFVIVFASLIPTLIYYFTVSYIAEPQGNIDSGQFWGSYTGLLFLSLIYLAIGIFASTVTTNQIVAFVLAAVISFSMLYGFDLAVSFISNLKLVDFIQSLGINAHYSSVSRGVIDSRDIIYFVIVAGLFLLLTKTKLRLK